MARTAVLMSIRPAYAEAILAGRKTVELRRKRPSFGAGTQVLVYASAPSQRVRGRFKVGGVLAAEPEDLWGLVRDRAGVSKSVFDEYFDGCDHAYAIEVEDAEHVEPAFLELRPPQSYLFLRREDRRHRSLLALTDTS